MLFSCILLNPYIYIILDTDGNISLIIHDEHILLGFIVLKKFIYLLLLLSDLLFSKFILYY